MHYNSCLSCVDTYYNLFCTLIKCWNIYKYSNILYVCKTNCSTFLWFWYSHRYKHICIWHINVPYTYMFILMWIFPSPSCWHAETERFILTKFHYYLCQLLSKIWKCHQFDKMVIIGCTQICHFGNFYWNHWWKPCQNNISISVQENLCVATSLQFDWYSITYLYCADVTDPYAIHHGFYYFSLPTIYSLCMPNVRVDIIVTYWHTEVYHGWDWVYPTKT